MISNNENWLIIGAGAIGLLWYSKFSDLKLNVTLLHRSKVALNSLDVENDDTSQTYELNEISDNLPHSKHTRASLAGRFNRVLFCTKSFDLIDAYALNKPLFSDDAILVTLCNGMGAQQTLGSMLPSNQTLFIGTTNEGALKLGKTSIKKTGKGDIYIGGFNTSDNLPEVLTTHYTSDINEKLLTKLAVNAVINPLTALLNVTNGELLNADLQPYYLACRNEVCNFFKHYQLDENTLANTIDSVAINTAKNRSSMLQDFSRGHKTEIEAISGFLIEEALKAKQELPIQTLLYDTIKNKKNQLQSLKKLTELISIQ